MASKRKPPSRKKTNNAPPVAAVETPAEVSGNYIEQYWPEQFASVRTTLFVFAAWVALAAALFATASFRGFVPLKVGLAQWLNLTSPEVVSPGNYDVALVLWGLGTVALSGIIHPGVGVGVLLLARPWLDGYTFFTENIYFVWGIYLLCALWLIQVITGRRRLNAPPPVLLLGGLLLVMAVVVPFSYQFNNSYQHLFLWAGYAVLFLLVVNSARDHASWGVLMTVLLVGMTAQAAFSIMHFEYLLPYLRKYLLENPAALQRHFGTSVLTPELAHRLNTNRAFGTMLFPNALAAFLLLSVPFTLATLTVWWRAADGTLKHPAGNQLTTPAPSDKIVHLVTTVITGIATFLCVFFVAHFPRTYLETTPFYLEFAPVTVFAFLVACGVSLVFLLLLSKYGLAGVWRLLRFGGTLVIALILLRALWVTYSRGAYLGLIFSALWGVALFWLTPARTQRVAAALPGINKVVRVALVLLVIGATVMTVLGLGGTPSQAQTTGNTRPRTTATSAGNQQTRLQEEGIRLSATEMVDPASLRLRFGYWGVALRMVLNNPVTGVGPGNFGVAYAPHQYIGAADVREAHNGFLQMFAETGLLGGLLFAAFWLYFGLWGAWRIITEEDRGEKLLLLGLYTGVTAFCLHAFLDINFSHPSLVMFVMTFAGLFYARAAITRPASSKTTDAQTATDSEPVVTHRIAATLLLALLMLCAGAVFRVYAQKITLSRFNFLQVTNDAHLTQRMLAGRFFLEELNQFGGVISRGETPEKYPQLRISRARFFLEEEHYERFADGCVYYEPSPSEPDRFLRLERGELPPGNGLMLVANRPYRIRDAALERIAEWMEELERIDRWFPHNHELAIKMVEWLQLHVHHVYGPQFEEMRPQWIADYLKWAETVMLRNPYHADAHRLYWRALLWYTFHTDDVDKEELFPKIIEQAHIILELTPIEPRSRNAYAFALSEMGAYYAEQGDDERAAALMKQAEEWEQKARDLMAARRQAQVYR